jgi:hypothetical protein
MMDEIFSSGRSALTKATLCHITETAFFIVTAVEITNPTGNVPFQNFG